MSLLNNYIDKWLSPPDDEKIEYFDCDFCLERTDIIEHFKLGQNDLCPNCYQHEKEENGEI